MTIERAANPYVVVLAGGEGTRLAPLTRALYGHDLPKQFAVLAGEKSLLQQTIDRALLLATADHVLVVVTDHREAVARAQLAPYPEVELVVQPRVFASLVGTANRDRLVARIRGKTTVALAG